MSWFNRTADDVVLRELRRVNKVQLGTVRADNARAPYTVVFSIKFLLPVSDARAIRGQPNFSTVDYPNPIRGLKEKKVFAPIRTGEGIVVRVFWYKYLGVESNIDARRAVAKFLDRLYPLTRDFRRPIVALRAHLVDWDLGFAVERSRLLDPWYSERTFGGLKMDTFNLKSWGMADGSPVHNREKDGLRAGKMDTWLERYERRNPDTKEAVDPITEKMQINPVALVRRELDSFLVEVEKKLPDMLQKAKRLNPQIAGLRARQALTLLRTSYFESQVRDKLFSLFLAKYNDPERGASTSDRRKLVADLRAWLWETVERRFL